MSADDQAFLVAHVDRVAEGLVREIRAVHHRIDESQAQATKEHDEVKLTLAHAVQRVDALESRRDRQLGARGVWMAWGAVAGVIAGPTVAVALHFFAG